MENVFSLSRSSRFRSFCRNIKNYCGSSIRRWVYSSSSLSLSLLCASSLEIYKLHHFHGLAQSNEIQSEIWKCTKAEKNCEAGMAQHTARVLLLLMLPLLRLLLRVFSVVIALSFSFRLYHACAIYYRMHSAHNALHIIIKCLIYKFFVLLRRSVFAFLFTSWYGGFIFFE